MAIQGQVVDGANNPVNGVRVELLREAADDNVDNDQDGEVDEAGETLLVATTTSANVDLNGDLQPGRDPSFTSDETGLFWFDRAQRTLDPGQYFVRIEGGAQTVSVPLSTATSQQWGVELPLESSLPDATIQGHMFNDVDQDGAWDDDEFGRAGWTVFVDLNGDGIFDPQNEPSTTTGSDGGYLFRGLTPGDSPVLLQAADTSEGTFRLILAHSADTPSADFATFDYSPFTRPADEHFNRFRIASESSKQKYLDAWQQWHSFRVENTTGRDMQVTEINEVFSSQPVHSQNPVSAAEFVTVYLRDGTSLSLLADGALATPIDVPAGQSVELFAFYDPRLLESDGVTVIEQFPDWFGDKRDTNGSHTFARDDHLDIVTRYADDASEGPSYRVDVVGASTYDSDIFHDGVVDLFDFRRLDDFLLLQWPATAATSDSPVFTQRVQVVGTDVQFTLSDGEGTTAPLSQNDSADAVEAALRALPRVGASVLDVTSAGGAAGGRWNVLLDASLPLLTIDVVSSAELDFVDVTSVAMDPFSDINARRPNAAESNLDAFWNIAASAANPERESALGDYGTLNVELQRPGGVSGGRARTPFLDLDPDNSSGAFGTMFSTTFVDAPVSIADDDLQRFATGGQRNLSRLTIRISGGGISGDELSIVGELPAGISVDPSSTAQQLVLAGDASAQFYDLALSAVRFSAASVDDPRTVRIESQAVGQSSDFGDGLLDETTGNVAITEVRVEPRSFGSDAPTPQAEGEHVSRTQAPPMACSPCDEATPGSTRASGSRVESLEELLEILAWDQAFGNVS